MTRRLKIWLGVAIVFTIINVGGVVPAALAQQFIHCGIHVVLSFVGVYWVWRVLAAGRREALVAQADQDAVPRRDDQLNYLQQSVDAVAVEVERLGEAQRYNAKLEAERREKAT